MQIILASKSLARQTMLKNAGLIFECQPADIDESIAQNSTQSPTEIAETLAAQKALHVSNNNSDALVIGSDQILECDATILTKAGDNQKASEKLKSLRGKTHHLISAVCVAQNGKTLWQKSARAALTMHDFSDEFLAEYVANAGEALTRSVGAYELEALGVQLFEKIEGDYFTILGMPLLPLLTYLREDHGVGL